MINIFKNLLFVSLPLGLMSCGAGGGQSVEQESRVSKSLVLYYSQTGVTHRVAEEIQSLIGADIERIDAKEPYSGDFMATVERCKRELAESVCPELNPLQKNIADYDTIFLGYPVWCGTFAPPVSTLLKDSALANKVIVPFCTFGSGGLETSVNDLKKALPNAEILSGYGVREVFVKDSSLLDLKKELERFLAENGYVKGSSVEQKPSFGEQQPVTEIEVKIFNEACGDYQFPLGTPVSFAKREGSDDDYEFKVDAKNPLGEDVVNTIYICKIKDKWMFTRVVR